MAENHPNQLRRISLFILRIYMGWMLLYAGLTKILNSDWSAVGYMGSAKTFGSFYNLFLGDSILPVINVINEWGLTLLGIALILGIFVRPAALLGALLMMLYYFPVLSFPYAGEHNFIIDDHIFYAMILVLLAVVRAGRIWGLDRLLLKKSA